VVATRKKHMEKNKQMILLGRGTKEKTTKKNIENTRKKNKKKSGDF
jgi:hypothetical protein